MACYYTLSDLIRERLERHPMEALNHDLEFDAKAGCVELLSIKPGLFISVKEYFAWKS